ncbi:hypothetical protein HID58_076953 [Brassica napus]|uniref:Uncharacterized protein n=1 Tax=Brassica napus TaxID=3708 RepID=A0ABQ7YP07_BRANA|nr:hypothetical protein HID58_076953 [Brassica napus]
MVKLWAAQLTALSRPHSVIVSDISLQLRAKLYSLDKEDSTAITRQRQTTYLSIWFGRAQV